MADTYSDEKPEAQHIEDGLGKEGLGKEGSQSSSDEEPVKMNFKRAIAIAALCIVYVGSQTILYFVGGALSYIQVSIHSDIPNWLLTANTLAVASICPFVGYLTDLLGRRWICIVGSVLLMISSIVIATTHSLGSAVTGMAIGGVGAGICELTALAGVAEITPVRWRGVSLALVTFSILPFIPYLIYIQELQLHSTWRWSMCIVGVWNFIGFVGLLFFYKPPPRHNVDGLSRMDILKQIDYVGAFLSIGGVTLFLVGLQAGGYQFPWVSAKVLAPLIIGGIMICLFPAWEAYGTNKPMVPGDIFKGQKVVAISLIIVFIAGMNFYSILGFFPVMLQDLYPPDPITIGVRALGYPLAILGGACIVNTAISYTNGHVRFMFFGAAIIMTAFSGALAASTPFNPALAVAMATIASFGIGAIIVPALTIALYACPDRYIGTTTAISLSVRFLGGSVGTAIYYNVFNSKISKNLPNYVAEAVAKAGLPTNSIKPFILALSGPNGATAASQVKGVTPQILAAGGLAAEWAFADSLKYVWFTTIAFGVIGMIATLFIPNLRTFMSNRLAVNIH